MRDEEIERNILAQEICNGFIDGTVKFDECGLCTGDIKKSCFVKSGITKGKWIIERSS